MSVQAMRRNISYCLGETIEHLELEYYDNFVDGDKQPFGASDFHYRSQDALVILDIRTRAEIEEQEEANMNLEELRAKLQRIRQQEEAREIDNREQLRVVP
ncbi:hypothetical protein F5B21DRAFT_501487 [Xylaria acuta]|nr:hypothetical protein F5B21DRAFT_501487 [Xylaria acuta]